MITQESVGKRDKCSQGMFWSATGGNTGIGFETAKALGRKGYHVIIASRDLKRGEGAIQRLTEDNARGSFELRQLCLDDLSNVKDFCKMLCDDGVVLDVLLNNAGVMACPEIQTKDGFEYQLGVNHLGHFALTAGLLPLMSDPSRFDLVPNNKRCMCIRSAQISTLNAMMVYSCWIYLHVSF
jgi:retinol dehydrogenase 12